MPAVEIEQLPDGKVKIKYICQCGKKIELIEPEKPERLQKCFDCIVKESTKNE